MPDIQGIPYNYNNELADTGVINVTPPSTGGDGDTNAPIIPSIFDILSKSGDIAKQENPWMKSQRYNEPTNTKLSDTLRYADPVYGFNPYNPNLENQYGDRQSWLTDWGHTIVKTGANAIGAFAQTIATIPMAVNALTSGDFSKLEDNPINNGVADMLEDLDVSMPTFTSTWQQAHPVLNYIPFVGNGWGKVMQNVGFVAGAIGASVLQDAIIGAATGGVGEAPLIGMQLANLSTKIGKMISGGSKAFKGFSEALAAGKDAEQALNSANALIKIGQQTRYALAVQTAAWSQAAMMANTTHRLLKDELQSDFYDTHGYDAVGEDLQKVNDYARHGANADMLATAALLSVVDAIQFPTLLKPFAAAKRSLEATLDNGVNIGLKKGSIDAFEEIVNQTKGVKGLLNKRVIPPARLLSSAGLESAKMGGQMFFQRTAEDFYKRKFDDDTIKDSDNLTKAMSEGIQKVFFTQEGMEGVIMGGLIGIAIHGLRGAAERLKGINTSKKELTAATLSILNNTKLTGTIENHYDETATSVSIQKDMQTALKNNDIFEFKNLQHQQLFELVHSGVKANRFESRIEQLKLLKELSPEEFKATFGMEFNEGTKATADQYIDAVIDKAYKIKSTVDKVNRVFVNPHNPKKDKTDHYAFEEFKKQTALDISEVADNRNRIERLHREIQEAAPGINSEKLVNLTSEEGIRQTIKDFKKRISDLEKDEKLGVKGGAREKAFLESKVRSLESDLIDFEPARYMKELHTTVNYLSGKDVTTVTKENVINSIDLPSVLQKAQDIYKLGVNSERATESYNHLLTKPGFEELMKKVKTKVEQSENNTTLDKNGVPVDARTAPQEIQEQFDEMGNPVTPIPVKEPNPVVPTQEQAAAKAKTQADAKEEEILNKISKAKSKKDLTTDPEVKDYVEKNLKDDKGNPLNPEKNSPKFVKEQAEKKQKENQEKKVVEEKEKTAKESGVELSGAPSQKSGKSTNDPNDPNEVKKAIKTSSIGGAIKKVVEVIKKIYDNLNPQTLLNRLNSTTYADGHPYLSNLEGVLFTASPEKIRNGASLKVSENTREKKGKEIPVKGYPKLFRRENDIDADLIVDGKPVGKLSASDTLFFKRDGVNTPIGEMTREEYVDISGNSPESFESFMNDYNAYHNIYNRIAEQFKAGKTEFSANELSDLFDIIHNYGAAEYVNNDSSATPINKLKYRSKGDVVISLPTIYDAATNTFSRSNKPTILGEKELSPEDWKKLQDFIGNNIKQIQGLNSRYVFIKQFPDGTYRPVGIFASRPAVADEVKLTRLHKILTTLPDSIDKATLKEINEELRNDFYIADSKNPKGSKTNITLEVQENGDVNFKFYNKDKGFSAKVNIPRSLLKDARDMQNIADIIDGQIKKQASFQNGLTGFELRRSDFKTNILNDNEVGGMKDVEDKLTVASLPMPFRNFSLKIMPIGTKTNEDVPAEPKPEPKVFSKPKLIGQLKPVFKKEFGEALSDVQERKILASEPQFDANGKLDPQYIAKTLGIKLPGAVKISEELGNIQTHEKTTSAPRPQNLTVAQTKTLDFIESSDRIPQEIKDLVDTNPIAAIKQLSAELNKPIEQPKPESNDIIFIKIGAKGILETHKTPNDKFEIGLEAPYGEGKGSYRVNVSTKDASSTTTGYRLRADLSKEFNTREEANAYANKIYNLDKEKAKEEILTAKEGDTVTTPDKTEWTYRVSSTVSKKGEKAEPTWQFKDAKGNWQNAGKSDLVKIQEALSPKVEFTEEVKVEEQVQTPVTLKDELGAELSSQIEEAAKVAEPFKIKRLSVDKDNVPDIPEGALKFPMEDIAAGYAPVYMLVDEDIKQDFNPEGEDVLTPGSVNYNENTGKLSIGKTTFKTNSEEFNSKNYLRAFAYENREREPIIIDLRGLTHEEIKAKIKFFHDENKVKQTKTKTKGEIRLEEALNKDEDAWLKPISPDAYFFYGHVSDIQKAFIAHKYDELIRDGKMTEQQLRDIVASTKRVEMDELGRPTMSESGLSPDLVDQVMFRVNHPELIENVDYWKTIPKDTDATYKDYIRTISEVVKNGDMMKALESGILSPEDARRILDATTKSPRFIGAKIEQKLEELKAQKKDLKEVEKKAAKEDTTETAQPIEIKSEGIETILPKEIVPEKVEPELKTIENDLNVGDKITVKIGDKLEEGKIHNIEFDKFKGKVVIDFRDENGDVRFAYPHQVINVEPKPKEIDNLTPEQRKRLNQLINQEELSAKEIEELGRLGDIQDGKNTTKELPPAKVEEELTEEEPLESNPFDDTQVDVQKLLSMYEDGDLDIRKAAKEAQELFDKDEQGIKDNLPAEHQQLADIIKKASNLKPRDKAAEPVQSLPIPLEPREGDTVVYNGQEYTIQAVDKTPPRTNKAGFTSEGNTYYTLDGDLIVNAKETTLPNKDSDLLETYEKATENPKLFKSDDEGVKFYDQMIEPENQEEADTKFTYVGLKTVLERLSNKFGLNYKVVDVDAPWKGRFKDGVVLINLRNVGKDTPFHEYLHPFIESVRIDNPELYNKLHELLAEDPEGQTELRIAKRFYKEDTEQEQKDEALITYLSKKMSEDYHSSGKRIESKFYEKVKDLINRFRTWIQKVVWGFNEGKETSVPVLRNMNPADFSKVGTYRGAVGKGEKIKIEETNFIEQMTLNDFAAFVGTSDVKFDLSNTMDAVRTMDRFQKQAFDIETEEGKILDRVQRKLRVLEDTGKTRIPSGELLAQAKDVSKILSEAEGKEALSVANYIHQGISGISFANSEFARINQILHSDTKLTPQENTDLLRRMQVSETLMSFYDDVENNLWRVAKGMDKEEFAQMHEVIGKNNINKKYIHGMTANLLTDWLYPYIEEAQRGLGKEYESFKLSREQFKNKLLSADADPGTLNYWLSSIGSMRDPVNAIVKTAMIDIFKKNHEDSNRLNLETQDEYHKFLQRTGLKNERKATSEYNEKNYLRKALNWEKTGEDKDGKPVYGYVERKAFHEEFFHDLQQKTIAEEIEKLGEQPDPGEVAAYKAWDDKRFAIVDKYSQKRKTGKQHEVIDVVKGKDGKYTEVPTGKFVDEYETVPTDNFKNPTFENLKADSFYQKIYTLYKEANSRVSDNRLPHGIIPQVSKGKNAWSDLKWSKGLGNVKIIGKALADKFRGQDETFKVQTEDGEVNFGNHDVNLDGSTYKRIKHAYTRLLDDADVDTVLVENVLKFHHAATIYENLKQAEPNIKALQDFVLGTGIDKEGRRVKLNTTSKVGVILDKFLGLPQLKEKHLSRLNQQLAKFIDDVAFDDGEFKDNLQLGNYTLSLNKLGSNLGLLTALNNMAFNVGGGIANVTIGNFQSLMEGFGGKYYTKKHWTQATGEYWANVHGIVSDVTNIKKSPITQLTMMYDAIQGEFRDKYGKNIVGSVAQRYANLDSVFFVNHIGEHEIQTTFMLAMMRGQKVPTKSGKELNLRDAYQPDKNGNMRLIDDAIWTEADKTNFMGRLHSKNYELNGNYSSFDKAMIQRKWYGKMALIYRKYLYNAYRARYSDSRMDYELRDVIRGNYNTFFTKLSSDLRDNVLEGTKKFFTREGWTQEEKYAYNKTVFELSTFIGTIFLSMAVAHGANKKEDNWFAREAYLRLLNLKADVGQYSIAGLPDMFRLAKNPSVVLGTLGKYGDFLWQLGSPTEVYQQKAGIFQRGDSKLMAKFLKAFPLVRQVINLMQPEEQAKFYQMSGGGK